MEPIRSAPEANERGQAYSLEGIVGAMIIVSALILGLQAVDPSPWADDGVEQEAEQLREQVADLLAVAGEDELRTAITCVTNTVEGNRDPTVGNPTDTVSDLDRLLNSSMAERGVEYTLTFEYFDGGGDKLERDRVYPAADRQPGDGSVTSTRTVLLSESDQLHTVQNDDGDRECLPAERPENTLGDIDRSDLDFYIDEQADTGEDIYALVRVRVVAW